MCCACGGRSRSTPTPVHAHRVCRQPASGCSTASHAGSPASSPWPTAWPAFPPSRPCARSAGARGHAAPPTARSAGRANAVQLLSLPASALAATPRCAAPPRSIPSSPCWGRLRPVPHPARHLRHGRDQQHPGLDPAGAASRTSRCTPRLLARTGHWLGGGTHQPVHQSVLRPGAPCGRGLLAGGLRSAPERSRCSPSWWCSLSRCCRLYRTMAAM